MEKAERKEGKAKQSREGYKIEEALAEVGMFQRSRTLFTQQQFRAGTFV